MYTNLTFGGISGSNLKLFGIVFILYSFYRGFRFWQKNIKKNNEEGEE